MVRLYLAYFLTKDVYLISTIAFILILMVCWLNVLRMCCMCNEEEFLSPLAIKFPFWEHGNMSLCTAVYYLPMIWRELS